MNILERRRSSLLAQFYCALEATDQQDLVQLIKYKGLTRSCNGLFCITVSTFTHLSLFMVL